MTPKLLLLFTTYLASVHSDRQHPYIDLASQPYFVDKSELLIPIFENYSHPHTYFTTPKHFGSTANLVMIDLFANIELDSSLQPKNYTETKSYHFFNQSKLGQRERYRYVIDMHLAQHPVIYLDLGAHLPKNFAVQSIVKYLLHALQKAFKRYEWLLRIPENRLDCGPDRVISKEDISFVDKLLKGRVNQAGVEESLKTLSRILYKYFHRKVVILIDSFDHALSNTLFYSKTEAQSDTEMLEAFNITNRMVSNAFQYLPYTISFMTGLTHAPIDSNHLGCVAHYNFLEYHKFLGYFGYTEDEVDQLLIDNSCPMPERNGVVSYYKGHRVIDGETKIFSPYSITQYLEKRLNDSEFYQAGLKPYFFGADKTSAILKFMPIPVFRHNLVSLVNREAISFHPIIYFYQFHFQHYFLLRNNNFTFAAGYSESFAESLLMTMILKMGYLCYNLDRNFVTPNTEIETYLGEALNLFYAPENDTLYEIGSLIYTIIGTEDNSKRESLVHDLESTMSDFFTRLSTIYDYTRIFELEYKFVTHKAIKKYQKESHDKGSVWTSGSQMESFLITVKADIQTTSAGVLQMSCNSSAVDTLGRAMKYIRPKVGQAPVTYFGISIDEQLKVKIETSTVKG